MAIKTVAFIGAGNMGAPMARNVWKAGFDVLVCDRNPVVLEQFRAYFGDERVSYADSLERHYKQGPAPQWEQSFVSAYASSHPWEDWAETWAHYLHIIDTLEMAGAFGVAIDPVLARDPSLQSHVDFDPYRATDINALVEAWLPLTYAVNSLNRAMGHPDLYPFVLPPAVVTKLGFIHDLVGCGRTRDGNGQYEPVEDTLAEPV